MGTRPEGVCDRRTIFQDQPGRSPTSSGTSDDITARDGELGWFGNAAKRVRKWKADKMENDWLRQVFNPKGFLNSLQGGTPVVCSSTQYTRKA
jgi:hypothetical protein